MSKKSSAAAALAALADPTRRQLIERLRSGPRAVGDLARGVPVSRPAVSQHLAVLKAAGLVRDVAEGTRRVYEIDPKGLGAIRAWLDDMWGDALGRFSGELEREQKQNDDPNESQPGSRASGQPRDAGQHRDPAQHGDDE